MNLAGLLRRIADLIEQNGGSIPDDISLCYNPVRSKKKQKPKKSVNKLSEADIDKLLRKKIRQTFN